MRKASCAIETFVIETIRSPNHDAHVRLLRLYPALGLKRKLVALWKSYYLEIVSPLPTALPKTMPKTPPKERKKSDHFLIPKLRLDQKKMHPLKADHKESPRDERLVRSDASSPLAYSAAFQSPRGGIAQSYRQNAISFLITGIAENYITDFADIRSLISLLQENKESPEYINTIRLGMIKYTINVDPTLSRPAISSRTFHDVTVSPLRRGQESVMTISARDKITKVTLLDLDPEEAALQLTIYQSKILNKITPHELIYHAQNCSASNTITPNLYEYMQLFIRLSYYPASEVLTKVKKEKKKKEILEKFVAIAEKCYEMGNMSAAFALSCGIDNTVITRIEKIWKKSTLRQVWELQGKISCERNFLSYRSLLKEAMAKKKNFIPHLNILLSDLTHALESSFVKEDKKFNLSVYNMIGEMVDDFISLQRPHPGKLDKRVVGAIESLASNVCINQDLLYQISYSVKTPKKHPFDLSDCSESQSSSEETLSISDNTVNTRSTVSHRDRQDGQDGFCSDGGREKERGEIEKEKSSRHLSLELISTPRDQKSKEEVISPKKKRVRKKKRNEKVVGKENARENCEQWNCGKVVKWLKSLGVSSRTRDAFKREGVNGFVLFSITESHLKEELCVTKLGERLTILRHISMLEKSVRCSS